jgi:hypothetical protein
MDIPKSLNWFLMSSIFCHFFPHYFDPVSRNSRLLTHCTQGRLNIITDPRAKQCTGAPTYTTTHRNKTVNGVDTITQYIYCIGTSNTIRWKFKKFALYTPFWSPLCQNSNSYIIITLSMFLKRSFSEGMQ